MSIKKIFGLLILASLMPMTLTWAENASLWQKMETDARCRQWVDSVMQTLSLKERIGQLMVYTIAPTQDKANLNLLRKVVKEYKIGGLLFSKGEIQNQVVLTNQAQQWADVPIMITLDGEWGLAMRLKDTPRFPRNMVLGCIQNDSLLYAYGREVARECREMGIQVNFAPVADVNINPKNPVINTRSFGEDPKNVARKVTAYARGLEDGGVLSVSKHFPGHGDTNVDSHEALPTLPFDRARLDSVELYPFRKVIEAGLNGIMVGHLAVPALEPKKGLPASLSPRIISSLLQKEMEFRGLTFTDALVMKGAAGHGSVCLRALQAGNDVLLVPRRIKEEVDKVRAERDQARAELVKAQNQIRAMAQTFREKEADYSASLQQAEEKGGIASDLLSRKLAGERLTRAEKKAIKRDLWGYGLRRTEVETQLRHDEAMLEKRESDIRDGFTLIQQEEKRQEEERQKLIEERDRQQEKDRELQGRERAVRERESSLEIVFQKVKALVRFLFSKDRTIANKQEVKDIEKFFGRKIITDTEKMMLHQTHERGDRSRGGMER